MNTIHMLEAVSCGVNDSVRDGCKEYQFLGLRGDSTIEESDGVNLRTPGAFIERAV